MFSVNLRHVRIGNRTDRGLSPALDLGMHSTFRSNGSSLQLEQVLRFTDETQHETKRNETK